MDDEPIDQGKRNFLKAMIVVSAGAAVVGVANGVIRNLITPAAGLSSFPTLTLVDEATGAPIHTSDIKVNSTNEAYRTFLSGVEGARHLSHNFIEGATKGSVKYVENIKNLTITREDLAEISTRVAFRNIDTLVFEDITTDDVAKHVESLTNVKVVVIPKTVSKASILLRSTLIDEIRVTK